MTVELIESRELWDKFVDESPHGRVFHKWDFLKIVEKYSGYILLPCGIFRGSILIGIFPLFFQNKIIFKTVFSPPPQSAIPYLGFLLISEYDGLKQDKKETYLNQIIDEISTYIYSLSPNFVSISIPSDFLDVRPFKWNKFEVTPNYNYVIHLNEDLESIWNGFKKNLRKQLSSPEIKNLQLIPSGNLSPFYNSITKRYEEQGLVCPIYNLDYLESLLKLYPNHLRIYYLYYNNDYLGSVITQEYKQYILWMGNAKNGDKIFSNEYIIWHLIQKAKNEGYSKFEIPGANKRNLNQFKSKFNPSLEICFNISKRDTIGKIGEYGYRYLFKRKY